MLDKLKLPHREDQALVVVPHVNIYGQEKDVVLSVEMPGADKTTLDVHLDGNVLAIRGKKKKDDVGKEYQLVHQERQPVEYQRTFELNADVDREKVRAEYTDGVLNVFLTRSEKAQPKNIKIKT